MIEIRITIEQREDGRMEVTHSTPAGQATLQERFVHASISHAINVMLALQGAVDPVEIPITKEMRVDPARN